MQKEFSWHLPDLEVRETNKGLGLFTNKVIYKGDIVIIFGGYVMTLEEERNLPEAIQDYAHQIHENFVLGVRSESDIQMVDHVNHSCDPNCGFDGQIFLVAMREVSIGEEITFDYAMVLRGTKENKLTYSVTCECGESNCRGKITENDWSIPELQVKYDGFFQPHIQKHLPLKNK